MPDDYYKTLGVSKSASADEIRRAYKKLVREYHPDAKPDDKAAAEKFKQIQDAYAVLSDDTKRSQYDQYGQVFEGAGPGGNPFGGGAGFDLNDILGGMFGGGGSPFGGGGGGFGGFGQRSQRAARPKSGQDIRADIRVPFYIAAHGGEHELTISRNGKNERLAIKVPAGVDSGSVIRLTGQGYPGQHGGAAGNLLVTVRVEAHPWFRRDGRNILVDVPITPSEAALGARVEVPTLSDGHVMLTIPPGTSGGAKLRMRGKGLLDRKTKENGDQIVVVRIAVPSDLTDAQKAAFEELARLSDSSPRDALWT